MSPYDLVIAASMAFCLGTSVLRCMEDAMWNEVTMMSEGEILFHVAGNVTQFLLGVGIVFRA